MPDQQTVEGVFVVVFLGELIIGRQQPVVYIGNFKTGFQQRVVEFTRICAAQFQFAEGILQRNLPQIDAGDELGICLIFQNQTHRWTDFSRLK